MKYNKPTAHIDVWQKEQEQSREKRDLEKAFDRIIWDFFKDILKLKGFSAKRI